MLGPEAGCWSWNESWTGCRAHWVHAVLPEHSGVPLVQAVQPGRGGVAMVRRRSTVRFRKGAPGGFHTSPVSRFTYGSDIVGLVAAGRRRGGWWSGWGVRRGVDRVPGRGGRG